VRSLPAKFDSARTQLEAELRKILAFRQVRANDNRLCQVFHSQILLIQLSYIKLIDEIQRAESPKYTIVHAYERGYTFEFNSDLGGINLYLDYPFELNSDLKAIVKNHEILAFSMCCHVFSKVVNKANSTVIDYAHGNLKFNHFQCITFAAWILNNFEGSLSCWWNSPPMFLVFFMIHQVIDYCSEPFGIIVVWHYLQYAISEQSLAYFNQRNVFSHCYCISALCHNCSSTLRMTY